MGFPPDNQPKLTSRDDAQGQPVSSEHPSISVLDALLDIDMSNPASTEQLRLSYCAVCEHNRGKPDQERDDECTQGRCGLRNDERLAQELYWALRWFDILHRDPQTVYTQSPILFNFQIWEAAAVTPGIGVTDSGTWGLTFVATTLRALIHASVIKQLTHLAGEVVVNVAGRTAKEVQARVSAEHSAYKGRQQQMWQRRVIKLYEEHKSIYGVAKALHGDGQKGRKEIRQALRDAGIRPKE